MNMMFVLVGMCFFCGVTAIVVGLKNQREERRAGRGRLHSRAKVLRMIAVAGCLSFACACAQAQEVIHALTGDVTAANPVTKTLTLKLADGSMKVFRIMSGSQTAVAFDREVQAQTTPAAEFSRVGANVVVFYYGFEDQPTAVAVKDLGSEPLSNVAGTVKDFDHHEHVVTLKGDVSGPQKFAIAAQTVVETPDGVIDGLKYHPNKGDRVGVVSGAAKGATALFIAAS